LNTTACFSAGACTQVCAVLCYAQQNDVEPFLEPVLLLAHAVMMHDTPSLAGGSSSGLLLLAFLPHVLTFLDLCTHADSIVALAAAQCLEALVGGLPAHAAAAFYDACAA
jgi:hypothetical protein